MYSYREKPKASVMNGLLAISIVCVIVMLFHTSFAYSIATVSYVGYVAYTGNLCATALLSGRRWPQRCCRRLGCVRESGPMRFL